MQAIFCKASNAFPTRQAKKICSGLQRLMVSQNNRTDDGYSGDVRYPEDAPWVNWGPYLWADGQSPRSGGLNWCNGPSQFCLPEQRDFRDGDVFGDDIIWWGNYTHPSAKGAEKVTNRQFFPLLRYPARSERATASL